MKILLVTGPAGPTQGWGDWSTTKLMEKAIKASGRDSEAIYITYIDEFLYALKEYSFDMVWCALYHFNQSELQVGLAENIPWAAEILAQNKIPFVGASAPVLKSMIDKAETNRLLQSYGIPTPKQWVIDQGTGFNLEEFPIIVKPQYESESAGISEQSIVHNNEELNARAGWIHNRFNQPALAEEYLPGKEWTVSVLGNGKSRRFYPVINHIDTNQYDCYPVIREDLKSSKAIRLDIPEKYPDACIELAKKAAWAVQCKDHVRIDIREDKNGQLKVIEINGIPGLNPIKSRSLRIQNMQNPSHSIEKSLETLVDSIITSAMDRYDMALPAL